MRATDVVIRGSWDEDRAIDCIARLENGSAILVAAAPRSLIGVRAASPEHLLRPARQIGTDRRLEPAAVAERAVETAS